MLHDQIHKLAINHLDKSVGTAPVYFLQSRNIFQFSSITLRHCSVLCPFLKPNKYGEDEFHVG